MRKKISLFKLFTLGCVCTVTMAFSVLTAFGTTTATSSDIPEADAGAVSTADESAAEASGAVSEPADPPTLWVVGDSTAAAFQDSYYYPRYGWGTQLERYFQGINIQNLAVSGTSTKSYLSTEQYQTLLQSMKAGDFLIIGFGHNDEKAESARYTDPNGSVNTPGSTQYYLSEYYFKPARDAGVNPVICTPIVRRDRGNNYTGESGHVIPEQTTVEGVFPGGDYAKAIQMAGVAKNVPVLNLTRRTRDLYEQLTAQGAKYLHAWVSSNEVSIDNTHTNLYGAAYNAWLIADELQKTTSPLKNYIIENPLPPDPSILSVNPEYQEHTFTRPESDSQIWTNAGDWKATVFGDIGGYEYMNPLYFTLQPYENGSVQLAAGRFDPATGTASVGKIASSTDGIAMYYTAVPADRNFTLSADITINQLDVNPQASFGLMVRDDIYLDTVDSDTLGDYVAAGPLMMGTNDPWNCFARKSGVLTRGGTASRIYGAGDSLHVEIRKTSDGYSCTFGDNAQISAGFDFPLTAVDSEYVYPGFFVARSADVSFWNISLELE